MTEMESAGKSPEDNQVLRLGSLAASPITNKNSDGKLSKGLDSKTRKALAALEFPESSPEHIRGVPTPAEIKNYLDRFVIGNEQAKRRLAVMAHNHYKANGLQMSVDDVEATLQKHFRIPDPESPAYKEFLNTCTRLLRREKFNRKKDNPVRTTLKVLISIGKSKKLIEPIPESFGGRAQPKTQATRKLTGSRKKADSQDDDEKYAPKGGGQMRLDNMAYRTLLSFMRLKRLNQQLETEIKKESLMLIGESGSGKTYMAEKLADFLGVPFLFVDASQITAPGYVGDDATSIYARLLEAAGGDPALASRGIVMLDELDKKAGARDGRADSDVGGSGAQSSLLRIVAGHLDQETAVDTSTVMFILAGKFGGLEDIVSKRLQPKTMGFDTRRVPEAELKDIIKHTTPQDLVEFGILRELVGRVGTIAVTDAMTQELLERIIEHSEDSPLREKQVALRQDRVELELDDGAKKALARHALEMGIGARGLKAILFQLTEDIAFHAPDLSGDLQNKIILDENYINTVLKRGDFDTYGLN